MEKPYIEKYKEISGFTVWIVDGAHIRTNTDEEFTNFGQHFNFKYIPEKEFWIDKEKTPGEEDYFIEHMLVEHRLMKEGASYKEAYERADRAEKRMRHKSQEVKALMEIKDKEELLQKIHKRMLEEYSKGVKVWIVDGNLVRSLIFIDFTEGGHDKVYSFIPPKEVWLDDDLVQKEIKFVLLHELHERFLMAQGWPYYTPRKSAHVESSEIEYHCRHHPEELDDKLKEEVEKNAQLETPSNIKNPDSK
jgi:hypothetical protein